MSQRRCSIYKHLPLSEVAQSQYNLLYTILDPLCQCSHGSVHTSITPWQTTERCWSNIAKIKSALELFQRLCQKCITSWLGTYIGNVSVLLLFLWAVSSRFEMHLGMFANNAYILENSLIEYLGWVLKNYNSYIMFISPVY